jgi:hypothetical protein
MEVDVIVEQLLARKTFSSESIKAKTRAALLRTLSKANAAQEMISVDEPETSDVGDQAQCDYDPVKMPTKDDNDGILPITYEDLMRRQKEKRQALREQSTQFFAKHEMVATIEKPVGVNTKMRWGYTALHFAALEGNEKECKRLLSIGADISARDNSGKMPWEKAKSNGHQTLAQRLKPT